MKTQYDVCVVGGGAAGMAAAIAAAEGGFFWGAYLNGAQFNIGGKKLPFGIFAGLKKYRYEGWSLSFVFRNVSEISAHLSGRATIA